jgi:hypothetical protein
MLRKEKTNTEVPATASTMGALRAILLGGLVAGSLDIGAACLINRVGPSTILQAIASGLVGPASFEMGARSAVLGLILQWFMSFLIAAIYVSATYLQPTMLRRWVVSGSTFGLPIYLVMNFVVVPFSAAGFQPRFTFGNIAANFLAMVLFGIVVAYCARHRMTGTARR